MLDEQARHLLDRPGVLGVVCTRRSDGSPQATIQLASAFGAQAFEDPVAHRRH